MKEISVGQEPKPISFRSVQYDADSLLSERRQPWFKLGYALRGVMDVHVDGRHLLCPPRFATWIPANALHSCRNRQNCEFVSVYIDSSLCADMPKHPCTLVLSPLIKSILADFASREVTVPETPQDHRLVRVLMDQLIIAPRKKSYLPTSDEPDLKPVIDALLASPGDRRSLGDWAMLLGVTERTLSRRFHREIGLSFSEWRQRLKLVASLSMLEDGMSVTRISQELGYNSASAFISMFKRLSGASPLQLFSQSSDASDTQTGISDAKIPAE
ncbi:AraC family transcriptional regulator [Thalassospira lucentensis]|uniref:AraC family transcriptional regulator n=1 Tax=Thalassospira lucentensis TaxID=168935 RepID=UPI003AA99FBB